MQLKVEEVVLGVLVFEEGVVGEGTEVGAVAAHVFEERREKG